MTKNGFSRFKRLIAIFTVFCLIFTMSMPMATLAATPSDISDHWAKTTIQNWLDKGYITGYPDGSFRPDSNITRAEFMTLVNKAFGYTETAPIAYSDVASDAWYANAVAIATKAGYISGYPDGTMKPDSQISREEAATIIMKINKLEANSAEANGFTDATMLTWSKGAVGAVVKAGIMTGYPDGSFGPQKYIKRGETTVSLDRAKNYVPEPVIPPVTPPAITGGGGGGGSNTGGGGGSSARNITSFNFNGLTPPVIGFIDQTALTIELDVPFGTDVTALVPTIVITGVSVSPASGVAQDFTNPVTYTVTAANGSTKDYVVTVESASVIVSAAGDATSVIEGDTLAMSAEVTPAPSTAPTFIWSVVNGTGTATIDPATGILTAVTAGTVEVVATVSGHPDLFGSMIITVAPRIAVTSITVSAAGDATTVASGSTLQMFAAVAPADATNQNVVWKVTNGTGTATINSGGLLTAGTPGTVTVEATAEDGSLVTDSLVITVTAAPVLVTDIAVSSAGDVTSILVGDNLQMSAVVSPAGADDPTYAWSVVAGTGTATIDAAGLLTAVTEGTVTVVATANDLSGVTGSMVITITAPATPTVTVTAITVTAAGDVTTVVSGSTLQMFAAVAPANATNQNVTWNVINGTGTATINSGGLLTAGTPGTVTVEAAALDGSLVTGSLDITVTAAPPAPVLVTDIAVSSAGNVTSILVGDNLQMSAVVSPAGADDPTYAWSVVAGTGTATIDAAGLLTAVTEGTVTVVATANDLSGVTGSMVITITAPATPTVTVTAITVTAAGDATTVVSGSTLQMFAAVAPANATNQNVTWSVINGTGTATINSGGLLTAGTPGTVTVEATALDGSLVTGSLAITVTAAPPAPILVQSITVSSAGNVTSILSGTSLQMTATVLPVDATDSTYTWSVVNGTGTATIDLATGILTAGNAGTVTVVATANDGSGVTGTRVITITAPVLVTAINVTSASPTNTVNSGATLQMFAAVVPANATNQNVTWSVATLVSGTATIDPVSGLLVAQNPGTVTVTATDNDGVLPLVTGTLDVTIVDITAPVIQLIGLNPDPTNLITVATTPENDAYADPGAVAMDNVDGNLTASIVMSGVVNTATAGSYTRTYTVTDAAGNSTSITRTVNVVAKLDPLTIPKYTTTLLIPWAMPKATDPNPTPNTDYYEIAMKQIDQQVLPAGMPSTTVWAYGSTTADPNAVFHAPSLTIEATANRAVRVKWINGLVDANGNYLPHIIPNDQTINAWPNPATDGVSGPSNISTDYIGPVPISTHLHGGHTNQESDGHPEAWYMPDSPSVMDNNYMANGMVYNDYKLTATSGADWTTGSAIFDYANDQRANTIWYHDHAMAFTRTNVYAGPAGFYLIRDNAADAIDDAATVTGGALAVLPGPAPQTMADYANNIASGAIYEIPLAVQDRTFNTDGSLFYPGSRTEFDPAFAGPFIPDPNSDVNPIWNPEFFGDTIMVNGNTWPTMNVQPKKYRLRFLNGSQARTYILGLQDQTTLTNLPIWQIGSDGGFLAAPVSLQELLLMPAERADVIVDFSGLAVGTNVRVTNVAPDGPYGGGVVGVDFAAANPDTTGQVMQFTVVASDGNPDLSTDPNLLVLPTVTQLVPDAPVRTLSLNEVMSMAQPQAGPIMALLGTATVDGTGVITPQPRGFMEATTEIVTYNDTEVWEIYNFTADAHPIHLHLVEFQVVNRQGIVIDDVAGTATLDAPATITYPESWENGYKDTVVALPGQVTRIKAKFDKQGQYVWHCHILEHEENDMMRGLLVQ